MNGDLLATGNFLLPFAPRPAYVVRRIGGVWLKVGSGTATSLLLLAQRGGGVIAGIPASMRR